MSFFVLVRDGAAAAALGELRTSGTFNYAAEAISHAEMNRLMA